jgi:hypothetical protein
MKTLVTCAASFVVAATLHLPANAGSAFDAAGTAKGTDKSVTHQLSEDHLVILNAANYASFTPDTPDNPMRNLSGDCFGMLEIRGPVPLGSGYCQWVDSDGGGVTIRWQTTSLSREGASNGIWAFLGGTGKWDGVKGGGSYSVSNAGESNRINTVRGAFVLKD